MRLNLFHSVVLARPRVVQYKNPGSTKPRGRDSKRFLLSTTTDMLGSINGCKSPVKVASLSITLLTKPCNTFISSVDLVSSLRECCLAFLYAITDLFEETFGLDLACCTRRWWYEYAYVLHSQPPTFLIYDLGPVRPPRLDASLPCTAYKESC